MPEQSIPAPHIGAVAYGRDIGHLATWVARKRFQFAACGDCGVPRWTRLEQRSAQYCRKCARAHMAHPPAGAKSKAWRGGRVISLGYWIVWLAPDDPMFVMAWRRKDAGTAYVLEHRLVMARALGRPLERWEQVHHRNGDKLDNRIENLQLWKLAHPAGVRSAEYHCAGCRCSYTAKRRRTPSGSPQPALL